MWPGAKRSDALAVLGSSNNNRKDSNDETNYLLNTWIHYQVKTSSGINADFAFLLVLVCHYSTNL